jgi:hypothetical protein
MPTAYCLTVCVRSLLFCQCVSTANWYDLTVDTYINSILLCCLGRQHVSAKNFYKLEVLPTTNHIMLTVGSTAYYHNSLQLLVPVWNTWQYDLDMSKNLFWRMCQESIILATCRHCLKHIIVTLFLYVSTELLFDNTKGRKYLAL